MRIRSLILLFFVTGALISCKDSSISGTPGENIPPNTYLTLDGINRSDDNRLVSQVRIRWWGDDPDGFITGYEFAIQDTTEGNWTFTTKTDSIFVLPIPLGNDRADVLFSVRAIDNEGLRDPNPPSLVFPIVNSEPAIQFRANELPSDTTFHVFSIGWNASDPDGQENLAYHQIAINDSINGWIDIPVEVDFVTIDVANGTASVSSGDVYIGRAAAQPTLTIDGIRINDKNKVFIRTFDLAGAESNMESHEWYVKQQTSRVLIINDDSSPQSLAKLQNHLNWLASAGITDVDVKYARDGVATINFKAPLSAAFQRTVEPTMNMALAKWDYIYWVSNDLDRNITYALEMTLRFFQNGGKMFINIPTKRMPESDAVFQFLPFERIAPLPPGAIGFLIPANSPFTNVDATDDAPHAQTFSSNITGVYPLISSSDSKSLYSIPFRVRPQFGASTPYSGDGSIVVIDPTNSIAFLGLDSSTIRQSDMADLLKYIIIDELGFEQ
jgi:hypothetical protein